MNYRHIFHAGNFADVFKHTVLLLLIDYLQKKDKPCFFLDTHAGIGLYDLNEDAARRTGEAEQGIGRLLSQPEPPQAVGRYLSLVRQAPAGLYPGSPKFMQMMLRPQDRLVANELHPEDSATLERNLRGPGKIRIEHRDGYEVLRALLPQPERRGVVLIDPPFEVRNEFSLMADAVKQALRRWETGMIALWYPIKSPDAIDDFHDRLRALPLPETLAADFYLRPPGQPDRLNGCGMVIVNPPYTLTNDLNACLPWLVNHLCAQDGFFTLSPLVPHPGKA